MKNSTLFFQQFRREWLLQLREPRNLFFSGLFFAMITLFFPFTVSPDPLLLRQIAPGVVWTGVLLTSLLTAERMFQNDYQDGVIEQWLVSGQSVALLVFAKVLAHTIISLLPMVLVCALLAPGFSLSGYEMRVMLLSFILGMPGILFLCALAAAFCTSMPQRGLMISLIIFPLVVPVMIFGSGALQAAMLHLPVTGYFAILMAFSLLAVTGLPLAIGAILRISHLNS